ncbi:quinol monooxygenase YgiN [Dysgonomonas sp. PFB1-18]|uniref:putative quinol monooxygenase n=1 Tax=unclassified Dysgonomonas TaxID=2630389 RepID=UPI002473E6E0|nr:MULTISPECIES: putative quinol monooxygenase [unclassified Dysgonomonas]MDH6307611.1 quinol monooxygenase YgiN [Dysgonomonas sp. PF1-14]MDH6337529.1 quinol monooxygenase YgiN [Dysgonomonas sp. PF1-16]MDH6378754.1 quinol monooxygenase YgiN [Dysgonomonas sp. PFB1-18]MDH6399172.1 quinol monooxygenase YgiN [Dysgonomonas sp. PF1-23]
MMELKIVAAIVVKAAYQGELENVFRTVVDATRKEAGNVSYDLHQDCQNPLKYTILEVWKSQAAIDEHNASAHFKAFVEAVEGKVDSLTVDVIKQIY